MMEPPEKMTRSTDLSAKPPFLFRAAAYESRGLNTAEKIDPLSGYDSQYHDDLQSIPYITVRHMLYDHIKWRYLAPSEFSSWSVSLLYVLVHAVRKAYYEDEHDVLVYVMDTTNLPTTNGMHNAMKLLKDYDVDPSKEHYLEDYAKGEYLIHGKLENTAGLWKAVDFDDILRAGFFEVFFTLKNKKKQKFLFQRVLGLRQAYFSDRTWHIQDHISNIQNIASCFGKEWEGVLTVALITIRNIYKDDDSVTKLLSALEDTSTSLSQLPWASDPGLRKLKIDLRDVPEAQQFMQLLQLLHDNQTALTLPKRQENSDNINMLQPRSSADTTISASQEMASTTVDSDRTLDDVITSSDEHVYGKRKLSIVDGNCADKRRDDRDDALPTKKRLKSTTQADPKGEDVENVEPVEESSDTAEVFSSSNEDD